jgi:hypothetical protein
VASQYVIGTFDHLRHRLWYRRWSVYIHLTFAKSLFINADNDQALSSL